jgi:predicted cation transporter
MHFLLILVVLMLAFPFMARVVGGLLKGFFWLILALVALTALGAFVHG